MPVVLLLMLHNVWAGASRRARRLGRCGASACTCMSLSQPALAQAFAAAQAGRALSAYNLLIFGGVFCVQWGIGLAIDALQAAGWPPVRRLSSRVCRFRRPVLRRPTPGSSGAAAHNARATWLPC